MKPRFRVRQVLCVCLLVLALLRPEAAQAYAVLSHEAIIDAAWDGNLHARRGNLALADGSVQQTKTDTLRSQISAALATGATNVIFSKPRGIF